MNVVEKRTGGPETEGGGWVAIFPETGVWYSHTWLQHNTVISRPLALLLPYL